VPLGNSQGVRKPGFPKGGSVAHAYRTGYSDRTQGEKARSGNKRIGGKPKGRIMLNSHEQ